MFDDELVFADEDSVESTQQLDGSWKVLIVDDEEQVHKITKISLDNFVYKNKNIEFLSAFSSAQAKQILHSNQDIVLILLDVVMESDDAGLELVKYIRENLNNNMVRIILRTGQPGMAPEEKVIRDYDINDYKSKTELTSNKLFTTMLSTIRSYDNIMMLLTEQKRNQEQKELLMQQSKLAMLGEMLGMITHQWKQPLANISANVSGAVLSIQFDNFKKDDILRSYNDIIDQVHFMSDTIDDFKNFFKPNKTMQKVYVQDVYDRAMTIMKSIFFVNNIKIIEDFQSKQMINIYFNELIQVFLNILSNAKDALLSNTVASPVIVIKTFDTNDSTVIEFLDNAGGIPQHIIENIFNAYFSTKGENGSGLGLYMSKTIVEEHLSGKLDVVNDTYGAKFTITIPWVK